MIDDVQNVTEKSGKRGIMGIVLLLVLAGSMVSMVPVYMQNRMDRLYKASYSLQEKTNLLNREILLRNYEINKLSSMDHLAKFAEKTELGLNDVPMKVMVKGVAGE